MNVAMKDHHVTGKDLMNLCASIRTNHQERQHAQGRFQSFAVVLAKALRRPGSLGEEGQSGQLGF